jgi:hypothetical protein
MATDWDDPLDLKLGNEEISTARGPIALRVLRGPLHDYADGLPSEEYWQYDVSADRLTVSNTISLRELLSAVEIAVASRNARSTARGRRQ